MFFLTQFHFVIWAAFFAKSVDRAEEKVEKIGKIHKARTNRELWFVNNYLNFNFIKISKVSQSGVKRFGLSTARLASTRIESCSTHDDFTTDAMTVWQELPIWISR